MTDARPDNDVARVVIRRARLADAVEVARLSAALGYPQTGRVMTERLRTLLYDTAHQVWVADTGADLAGWAAAQWRPGLEFSDRVELTGLVVDPAWRRHGVGAGLLDRVEAWARNAGVDTVFLCSNVRRDTAHVFYPKRGYARTKTQHVYTKLMTDD